MVWIKMKNDTTEFHFKYGQQNYFKKFGNDYYLIIEMDAEKKNFSLI